MADINHIRLAPLLWPAAQHPTINANDNKGYNKSKDRAYRNPRNEPQDEKTTDSDKHLDEYA